MVTDRDMRNQIEHILLEGTPDGPDGYQVDLILEACHEAANGWDLEQVDLIEFWQIVEGHEKTPS